MTDRGLVVVDRDWLARMHEPARSQLRSTLADVDPEDVFRRYRGFDGRPWPVLEHPSFRTENGLASLSDLRAVKRYLQDVPEPSKQCEVILVDRGNVADSSVEDSGWEFVGFDAGYFESEWSVFSMLLHEVALGHHDELRAWAPRLNGALLLSTRADVEELFRTRQRLVDLGLDLETSDPPFRPIAVFIEAAP